MIRRQLAERASANKQQCNDDSASEISEITGNPEQRGLCPTCVPFTGRYSQVHIVASKQLSVCKDDNHQTDAKESRCDHRTHRNVVKVLPQYPEREHHHRQAISCADCTEHVAQRILLQQANFAETRIRSLHYVVTVSHYCLLYIH